MLHADGVSQAIRRLGLTASLSGELSDLLQSFSAEARNALDSELIGLYVSGSLMMGDFEPASSDIDFLAVTSRPLDASDLPRIAELHNVLAGRPFGERLEGSYAAKDCLHPWGIPGNIVSVEPGTSPAYGPGDYSADNMWALRNASVDLLGPPSAALMPEVDPNTLRAGLLEYLEELLHRPLDRSADELSASLLNIARCLYGMESGRACVKSEAAAWLCRRFPEVEPGLSAALQVRKGTAGADPQAMRLAIARLARLRSTIGLA